jgi:hypothetical protein
LSIAQKSWGLCVHRLPPTCACVVRRRAAHDPFVISSVHRSVTVSRPFGIQLLAALLTIYTIGGFTLAFRVSTNQDDRYRWWLIAAAAVAFAVACGVATLSVWRLERKSPWLLVACATLGSMLCLSLPAAVSPDALAPGMWRTAIQGAVLILAFLLLAAWYVRNVVRARA